MAKSENSEKVHLVFSTGCSLIKAGQVESGNALIASIGLSDIDQLHRQYDRQKKLLRRINEILDRNVGIEAAGDKRSLSKLVAAAAEAGDQDAFALILSGEMDQPILMSHRTVASS